MSKCDLLGENFMAAVSNATWSVIALYLFFFLIIYFLIKKKIIAHISSWGFPGGSVGKESACNTGDVGLNPGLGRSPGEGNSYPLQYSGLENSMDWIVHGVTKSRTRLRDFHFTSLLGIILPFLQLTPLKWPGTCFVHWWTSSAKNSTWHICRGSVNIWQINKRMKIHLIYKFWFVLWVRHPKL